LKTVLSETEATAESDGKLEVELTKTGREVVIRGKAQVSVTIPCVVTLDPLAFELVPEVFLLLSPPGSAEDDRPRRKKLARRAESLETVAGATKAPRPGKTQRAAGPETDLELSERTAALDTYDGEKIVLDEFIREFILLELPPYPRRSDLPSGQRPAIGPPTTGSETPSAPVDPRLLPLAQLKSRLSESKKE
jgi:uncharacterized metal-binding protein YceD (DUF177 family)